MPVIVSVLVLVPFPLLVVVLIVARPPRLTPLTRVVPFFFHTKVNGMLPCIVVVNVAVVPIATCWFVIGVVTTAGTQSVVQVGSDVPPTVGSSVIRVLKLLPDTVP